MMQYRVQSFANHLAALLMRAPFGDTPQQERMTTDALSGLRNRDGFEADGTEMLRMTTAPVVSAMVFDIDAFAAVNRVSGPAAGDRVLTALGSIISEAATDRDVAGRIGGAAFAVVLPGLDLGAARLFAEAVRTRFCACDFGTEIPWALTLSGGVAEHQPGEALQALIARADQSLYAAKKAGGDRIAEAQALPEIASEMQTA